MSEQESPKELTFSEKLAEKIADLRSKEQELRNRGAFSLTAGALGLAVALGITIGNNTAAVNTASKIAQDYDYGQDQGGYTSTKAEVDQSQQHTIDLIDGMGAIVIAGLGAASLGNGVSRLSEVRQSGNLADLLEARLIFLPEQTSAPTQIEE